jgi:hypothetical protein
MNVAPASGRVHEGGKRLHAASGGLGPGQAGIYGGRLSAGLAEMSRPANGVAGSASRATEVGASELCRTEAEDEAAGLDCPGCGDGASSACCAAVHITLFTGQILAPATFAGPVSGVAPTTFDGLGNLTQIDNIVHNGVVPVEDWWPANGSYTVNSGCTGTFPFTPAPTNPADAGPPEGCISFF